MTTFFESNPIIIFIILIILALFIILGTFFKAYYFWENYIAKGTRKILGDKFTQIFYYLIGFLTLILAFKFGQITIFK